MTRSRVVAFILGAAILTGGYAVVGGGGGGGPNWAGTFDCYGTTGCSGLPSPASCTSTISSGLQTALNSATGGEVICLNSGSYGNISLTSKSYSSVVTVQPVNNATVTVGNLDLTSVTNLHFTGNGGGSATMGIGGSDPIDGSMTNFTVDYATYTDCTSLSNSSFSNVLFDHDKFDNIGPCTFEGRVEVFGPGSNITNNLTISNSRFSGAPGGNCTDGIQVENGGGMTIGPGDEFTNIDQSVCTNGAHADPIQFFESPVASGDLTITGNYFHANGTGTGGVESFDGHDQVIVKNNVFLCTCNYPHSIAAWGGDNWTITHNSFDGGGDLDFSNANNGETPSGNIARDNAWGNSGSGISGTGFTASFDLNSAVSGTGNISGTTVFVSSPASGYYHYQLDSSSPGFNAASDGKSMGICSTCG